MSRTEGDVHLSITPFSFVAMVVDLLTPLCAANTIHILSEEERRDPARIVDYLSRHDVTTMFASPQLLRQLPQLPSCLRVVDVGGERMGNVVPNDVAIRNAYGMSEIAGTVFARVVERAYEDAPLGEPLPGSTAYLLDEDGKPVSAGEEGELYLAGPMARGYLNLPELTAQTFLKNPFASKDGHPRLLRTGDVFVHDAEHGYTYVNRCDWMVKINGQRVELGEVETRLASHPHISAAACCAFTDKDGQTYVAAYYSAKDDGGKQTDDAQLRDFLAQVLPRYMIPRFIVRMDELPLNANGKIDRRALPEPDVDAWRAAYVAGRTSAKSWCARPLGRRLGSTASAWMMTSLLWAGTPSA